jgi:hypothetical protein
MEQVKIQTMSQKNYLPKADSELNNWLNNFSSQLLEVGTNLGILFSEVQELNALIRLIRSEINTVAEKRIELKSAIENKESKKAVLLKALKTMVYRVKNHPLYEEEWQGKALGIEGQNEIVDFTSLKPVLKATVDAGRPRIIWKKGPADAINIYVDRRGENGFVFLTTDTEPDYIDTFTLPPGDNFALWDYKAIYIKNDHEVGLFSDPISIAISKNIFP